MGVSLGILLGDLDDQQVQLDGLSFGDLAGMADVIRLAFPGAATTTTDDKGLSA